MKDLKVTTIQADLYWENAAANLEHLATLIQQINEPTDVVVLPEMFTTGFTMKAKDFAEPMKGVSITWMANQAKAINAVVTGSLIVVENGKYYNRLIWMEPDGTITYYDKRHLFAMADEHKTYEQGKKKVIATWKGWKFCLQICYDLRFPAFARNLEDYDALIYMANWPITRNFHWKILLQARAIENQAYVIGVNRSGKDGLGFDYSGDTSIISPYGDKLFEISNKEGIGTATLSVEQLNRVRTKLPFLADRDNFKIEE